MGTNDTDGKALGRPDFIGYSEMESFKGIPGGDVHGYADYKVIGSVCKLKYVDPMGLYYDSRKWSLIESYPASSACGQYPPPSYDIDPAMPFDCASGQASPGNDTCCACTNMESLMDADIFEVPSWNVTSYFGWQGSRPFVAGRFSNKLSGRNVCVVAFNLPHPLLANCTHQLDAACFSNEAMNAYRIGTGQLVNTINDLCKGAPLIFAGDTNIASGLYPTSYMFYNPNYGEGKDSRGCSHTSPTLALRDPPSSLLPLDEQPYTCCVDPEGVNLYASDRVSASGMSADGGGNFFAPRVLLGGARRPGEPVSDPGSVGTGSSCPGVDPKFAGLPCCGAETEHAPVWGFFDLIR